MKTAAHKGNVTIDSVMVGEATIDAITNPDSIVLSAKFAFAQAETGRRLGWSHKNLWSEGTNRKLLDLIESMEADILQEVFGEEAHDAGGVIASTTMDGIPGL